MLEGALGATGNGYHVDHPHWVAARVNNKEGKRVSNALYTPYKMFSENHAPGIQKLTNQSARFEWYVVGVVSSAS